MTQRDEQQYYVYYAKKNPVTIVTEFDYNERQWVIVNDGECFGIYPWSELIKYEESEHYKYQEKQRIELEQYRAAENEITQRIQKKALQQLESRIRLNVAFSPGGTSSYASLMVAQALKEMIEKFDTYDLKKDT